MFKNCKAPKCVNRGDRYIHTKPHIPNGGSFIFFKVFRGILDKNSYGFI